MGSPPLPITQRTAARLLAEHVRDTSTVGAVIWHRQSAPSARLGGALVLLAAGVILLIAAAL